MSFFYLALVDAPGLNQPLLFLPAKKSMKNQIRLARLDHLGV